jgi:acetamidase/formamidase
VAEHRLSATDETVRVGLIDRSYPPVLTIDPGDVVAVETWNHWGDAVTPDTTIDDVLRLREIEYPNRGPHSMTGPIRVRGAMPGHVLRIDFLELKPRDHGFNLHLPGRYGMGLLPDDFPEGGIKHFNLDLDSMTTAFSEEIRVPLAPFLGIIGVAPEEPGPHSSVPPGTHGGNIDLADLVEGTSLFLPVFVEGALFYVGDAHACQGNGEVNLSAIETAMRTSRLRVGLLEDPPIRRPYATTPEHFITLAFDPDLDEAVRLAVRNMIDWLSHEHQLSRADAYSLCSVTVDACITQVVNQARGAHAKVSKRVFA